MNNIDIHYILHSHSLLLHEHGEFRPELVPKQTQLSSKLGDQDAGFPLDFQFKLFKDSSDGNKSQNFNDVLSIISNSFTINGLNGFICVYIVTVKLHGNERNCLKIWLR